jgi:hypothetical protein
MTIGRTERGKGKGWEGDKGLDKWKNKGDETVLT